MMVVSCASRLALTSEIDLSNSIVTVSTSCALALSSPDTPATFERTSVVSCRHGFDSWWRSKASIPEPDPEMKTARRRGFSTVASRIDLASLRLGQMVLPDEVGPWMRRVIWGMMRAEHGRAVGVD